MNRNPSIDALRGVLLILMTLTHLPTTWSGVFGQPLGFVSSAEGFVFLSAFVIVGVFQWRLAQNGAVAARRWLLGRTLRVYLIHLALVALAFGIAAPLAVVHGRPAVQHLLDFYLASPRLAIVSAALLVYRPPLLDILPMYVLLMLITGPILSYTARRGWAAVLTVSAAVWLFAQIGLRRALYALAVQAFGDGVPYTALGSFDLFAWQFLWVLGLWLGVHARAPAWRRADAPGALLAVCGVIAFTLFFWRHLAGVQGFQDAQLALQWLDKWSLAPLRLLNFLALVGLVAVLTSRHALRVAVFERLGRASLWVFAAHIVSVVAALLLIGDDDQPFSGGPGLAVLAGGLATLFVTARIYQRLTAGSRPGRGPRLAAAG